MARTKETPVVDYTVKLSDLIVIEGRNPRTVFAKADIKELAEQIKGANGILVPLLVEARNEDEKFPIVNGEMRYRALHLLKEEEGLTFPVPVHIVKPEDEGETLLQAMLANESTPLDAIDLARATVALVEEHGYERKQVYAALGKTHAWLSQRFTLAKATPDMVKAYRKGDLSIPEILELVAKSDDKKKKQAATAKGKDSAAKGKGSKDEDWDDTTDDDGDDDEETVEEAIQKKTTARQEKKTVRKEIKQKEKETGTKLTPLQKSILTFLGGHGLDGLVATTQKAVDVAVKTASRKEKPAWEYISEMLEVLATALADETDSK